MTLKTFTEIDGGRLTDKGTNHGYLAVYEMLFASLRDKPVSLLEIGVDKGGSLKMWDEAFPLGTVWGCDISAQYQDGRVKVLDSLDGAAVERAFGGMMFDIIIDDGNHELRYQVGTYNNFRSHLAPGGIYVIEDVSGIDTCADVFRRLDPERKVGIVDLTIVMGHWDDTLVVVRAKP